MSHDFPGAAHIAGDVRQRPSSEHRYTRETEHGAVPLGRRHRIKRAEQQGAPFAGNRQRVVLTGRRLVSERTEDNRQPSARSQQQQQQQQQRRPQTGGSNNGNLTKRRVDLIRSFIDRNHAHVRLRL